MAVQRHSDAGQGVSREPRRTIARPLPGGVYGANPIDGAAPKLSPKQRLIQVLRDESILVAGVLFKFSAALLILEGLAWIGSIAISRESPATQASVMVTGELSPVAAPMAPAQNKLMQTSAQQQPPRTAHGPQ
jgi:hypothetical protein